MRCLKIPFLDDFKVHAAITNNLLEDVKLAVDTEMQLLNILDKVGNIDDMWLKYNEINGDFKYSTEMHHHGSGRKKQKTEEICESSGVSCISRQEENGTLRKQKNSLEDMWKKLTKYGKDIIKYMLQKQDKDDITLRQIVDNSKNYWKKYEEQRERKIDQDDLKVQTPATARLRKIMTGNDSKLCFIQKQNPNESKELIFSISPEFITFCKEKLNQTRLPSNEYINMFEKLLQDAADAVTENMDLKEKVERWQNIKQTISGTRNDVHWQVLCYMFCRTGKIAEEDIGIWWGMDDEKRNIITCDRKNKINKMDKDATIRNYTTYRPHSWRETSAKGCHLKQEDGKFKLAWK